MLERREEAENSGYRVLVIQLDTAKKVTDNVRNKIIFLLKNKAKIIDQLKKISPESTNNDVETAKVV